jgi:HPr kinase/phosphorylase
MTVAHATCVALGDAAVLLRGPSGSGKSDLALRFIDGGGHLVADDQVALTVEGGVLVAAPPPPLAGLIEVRGVGIVRLPHLPRATVRLVADLVEPARIERAPPEARRCRLLDLSLPLLLLDPFAASACAKLRLALRVCGHA